MTTPTTCQPRHAARRAATRRLKMSLLLLPVFLLLLPTALQAQGDDTSRLSLRVDGTVFFVNNEYTGSQLDGYTLPGFMLRPRLGWRLDRHVTIEAGANWLHFWGAHGFPQGPLTEVIPVAGDSLRPLHLVPWLQARISLAPWLTVVLGSLDNDGHRLPLPLYNPERLYATDPETGAQVLVDSRYLNVDAWVDWQEFIWYRSAHQERFNCGLSLTPRYIEDQWQVSLPLRAVVQHRGGEGLANPLMGHTSYYNLAAGASGAYTPGDWVFSLAAYAMFYSRTGAPEGQLVYDAWGRLIEPPPAFKRGHGTLATLTVGWRSTMIDLHYWTGDKFVPLLGSYLFSNLSSNIDDMTHRRLHMLMLCGNHTWHFTDSDLLLQGAYIHTFAHAADRLDYWPCSLGNEDMFSFGLLLRFHPTISLVK